jgi:hypothetical protein
VGVRKSSAFSCVGAPFSSLPPFSFFRFPDPFGRPYR